MEANERLYKMIVDEDDVTWQGILYDLVKKEEMDPWDLDVSALTKKYIETIKNLKELDFRLSGKVLLAAAILLKIKSKRLINEELNEFDRLLTEPEEELAGQLSFDEDFTLEERERLKNTPLIPRTPQPRKRKVSIFDLMKALEKALEVKQRRVLNSAPPTHLHRPKKVRDMTQVIRDVYGRIKNFFNKKKDGKVLFTHLLQSNEKEEKVFTFIPLLHLSNQRKVDLEQEQHFGEIRIKLATEKEVNQELAEEA